MEANKMTLNQVRNCDGCTVCCRGWLFGSAHGHSFFKGTPCHFVGEMGCTIYKERPEDPCKTYKCAWLTDFNIPEWFKPNLSNVICTWKEWKSGFYYLEVLECGKKLDSKILSWLFVKYANNNYNLHYELDGGNYYVGENEFLKYKGVK
jgi:hypothetical protein